ncbi:phosphoserine phosphatase serb [Myriangium duriaei CBS 260.36]|uniref:phosphoserine phosphatase n=1 Tax=Myriangium duriaei CBS 260.36 TaxID=1168546 RepID=A0A9P4IVP5_9PEZI|nr:phosphoserine phosphatase serb [Myriangium duriaei CBS 260.36]
MPELYVALLTKSAPLPAAELTQHFQHFLPVLQQHFPTLKTSPQDIQQHFSPHPSPNGTHKHLIATLALDFTPTEQTILQARTALQPQAATLGLWLVLHPHTAIMHSPTPSSAPRLAVFDMDSTLIQQEVIDELARAVGQYDRVAAITEAAMRGEEAYKDFELSLRARVALLKGVEGAIWDELKRDVIRFTPGAKELIRCLKSQGWKTAVLSGGFVPLAEWVKGELGLDYAYANRLETDGEGRLTGRLEEGSMVVDGQRKKALLREIAEREGVARDAVIAVGDGSNDLPMMGEAALGIAFNAKPKVQERAPAVINGKSLLELLSILGWTESDIKAVLES